MNRLSRLRHLGVLAALLVAAAALPAYAARVLGTADTFLVLAGDQIVAASGSTTINGKAGSTNGVAGGGSFISSTFAGAGETAVALTDLAAARTTLSGLATDVTLPNALDGQILTPGNVYRVNGDATLGAGQAVTLNGSGEYVINITGSLTTGAGSAFLLANGASAANVYLNVGTTATLGNDTALNAILLTGGDINVGAVAAATTEKLLSQSGDVIFNGGQFNDPVTGAGSAFSVSSAAPLLNGCFQVVPGQSINVTVSAAGPNSLELSVTDVPANLTFNPNAGGAGANGGILLASGNPASSTATFAPAAGQANTTFRVNFLARDATTGVITSQEVCFQVGSANVAPTFGGVTPGQGVTLTVCPNQQLAFSVSASDTDATDQVNLSVTGAPGTAVFTPSLPANGNPVSVNATFTPTPAQVGQTFNLSFTANDGNGGTATRAFSITVETPVPTTVNISRTPAGSTVNAGEQVCFTVTVLDQCGAGFPGQSVSVTISGGVIPAGTTGGGGLVLTGTTDANGVAVLCFTPQFPGEFIAQAAAGALTSPFNSITVVAAGGTANGKVVGNGFVPAPVLGDTKLNQPANGLFNIDIQTNRRGRARGGARFTATGLKDVPGGSFRLTLTRVDSLTITDTPAGRLATVFGRARTNFFGTVDVRIDALDAATPGVPADSFLLTMLVDLDGDQVFEEVVVGGNLLFARDPSTRLRNDIVIAITPSIGRGGGGKN